MAKRLHEPYLPDECSWVKVKKRAYSRWELEREGAFRNRGRRPGHRVVGAASLHEQWQVWQPLAASP